MRTRVIGVLFLSGLFAAATAPARMEPLRQWATVNFARTTVVAGRSLNAGEYLIVHDFAKEARNEPCTSVYSLEGGREVAAFRCVARERPLALDTTLALDTVPGDTMGCTYAWSYTNDRLKEFQFAGDTLGHGVPERGDALTGTPPPDIDE
jgi:hypothetical protein